MKNNKASFFERLTGNTKVQDKTEFENKKNFEENTPGEVLDAELAIDMYQTPTEIIVKTMVAGVKPEDLTVSISREMITVKGSREMHHEITDGDVFTQELYWGSFSRTIMLPEEVDADNAEAVEKHGLLTIRLPKIQKERTKSLKVRSI